MPKIIIERPSQWPNKAQKFNIYIDTKKVGDIGNDETVQFDVSPGQHNIEIRLDWLNGDKSFDVNLSINENKTIKVFSSTYTIFLAIIIGALVATIYTLIKNQLNLETTSLTEFLIKVFLIALAIVPFLRRFFWRLKEVETEKV